MIRRFEFIEKTLYLIRKELSEKLPIEGTLDEMVDKALKLIKEIYNK